MPYPVWRKQITVGRVGGLAETTQTYQIFKGSPTLSGWIYTEKKQSWKLDITPGTTIVSAELTYTVKPDKVLFSDQFAITLNGNIIAVENWDLLSSPEYTRSKTIAVSLSQGSNIFDIKWSITQLIPILNSVTFDTDILLTVIYEGEPPKPPNGEWEQYLLWGMGLAAVAVVGYIGVKVYQTYKQK